MCLVKSAVGPRDRCGCACPSLIGAGTIGKNGLVGYDWLIHNADGQHVDDLRSQIGKDSASVLIFLGAGLSFGVGAFSAARPSSARVPGTMTGFHHGPT